MEQRSDTNIQPVQTAGAGVDPAYVPGLVNVRAPEAEAEEPEAGKDTSAPSAPPEEDAAPAGAPEAGETPEAAAAEEPADAEEPAAAADGPSFEASDRRGSVVADSTGVRFTLDDQAADFRWDEIGAVEIATPRFGKRFSVIVHVGARRWYETEVDAPNRATLKRWSDELDAVLDAYFEEGRSEEDEPAQADAAEAEDDSTASGTEAKAEAKDEDDAKAKDDANA
ncbi:hypothetical protein [Streptomyces montanisoli]|uniref:Uncharacterized protein n=1 Tax=Streptomyces montanisoli TaxID=2798581 RepID=A0A940RW61_9ACTN|nr:hypothetical protein [Streptomyces montanisoli]MBP0459802.1 hypothetical protein [Streptomyces montanisoli]